MKTKKWIQKIPLEKDSLHHQLGVRVGEKIPKTLLEKIVYTPAGTTIHNPTKEGIHVINVTPLLKKRANFALNVRK